MGNTWSRGQLEDRIAEQVGKDPHYYKQLMDDPRRVVGNELGIAIPPSISVRVLEETQDAYYIVLPYRAPADGA